MSVTFRCDDKETLVAYLYGEIEIDAKREVDRHLRTCIACADEVAALQSVRRDLDTASRDSATTLRLISETPAPVSITNTNGPAPFIQPCANNPRSRSSFRRTGAMMSAALIC